jgi:hypothetical protein
MPLKIQIPRLSLIDMDSNFLYDLLPCNNRQKHPKPGPSMHAIDFKYIKSVYY